MNKKTVRDVDVKGKRVLVRCDFNVPLDEQGRITDDTRIRAALPTIQYLMQNGAKVVLCSHLGRPKGEVKEEYSLKPVAEELTELLDTDVKFATDVVGNSAKEASEGLKEGEVALLENVRFDPREEKNDDTLSMELASLSDGIYVNDAFGAAHRAHSSTAGVAEHVDEAVAGFLMEKEVEFLSGTLEDPDQPFVAIIGGKKVSDKIGVLENLIDKVDEILIGGGMAFTFLKAKGYDIGDSICEEDKIKEAKRIMDKAEEKGVKITLPKDVRVSKEFSNDTPDKIVESTQIPEGYQGLDIGPKTCREFAQEISQANTILWNGPLGVCEFPKYAIGTQQIAMVVGNTTKEGAVSVIGGGDSVAAIKKLGLSEKEEKESFTHISTGGGASLELLEGKELPGVACLTNKKEKNIDKEEGISKKQCQCKKNEERGI